MDKEDFETLSAFMDGEKIETEKPAKLLNTRGAQEMLRDFLLLRLEVQNDQSQPTPAFYEKLKHRIEPRNLKTSWWRYAVPIPMPVLVTMLIAVVSLTIWIGLAIR
jgi:negative regulator of sigma E activity